MHAPPALKSAVSKPHSSTGGGVLLLSAIVAALGSLLFGFDTAVISGTTEALRSAFALNDNLLGFTVSSALIGTMFGALGAGQPADWWGRRPVLTVLAVMFLISAAGCAGAWNWYALLFFRFLGGVAVGAASVVCPMYSTEIAPARRRGLLVCVSQLNIVLGIDKAIAASGLTQRTAVGLMAPAAQRETFENPMERLVDGYVADLKALGRSTDHVRHVDTRLRRLMREPACNALAFRRVKRWNWRGTVICG